MNKLDYRKYCLIIVSIVLVFTVSGIGQTYITGGNVSGTWTSGGSPYYIQGEITIPNGETLSIEPAVSVVFMGHFKFNVQGRLLAIGTQLDSISFTADNTQTGWHGIRFNYTPNTNDTSKIIYCSFRYGKANTGASNSWDRCGGAILIGAFDKVFVSDCLFEYNMTSDNIATTGGAAIFINMASPIITNSTFRHNSSTCDGAILCGYLSINSPGVDPILSNNVFKYNSGIHGSILCAFNNAIISGNYFSGNSATRAGGGVFTYTTNARVENNIIINNQSFGGEGEGGGIKCYIGDKALFINNTVAYNSSTVGGGICCNVNSDPVFINNIVWGNTATNGNQVYLVDTLSDPDFKFCDIQGGKEAFGGPGSGIYYTGLYANNIDSDPSFVDVAADNFRLSDTSLCIGTGIDSTEIDGEWYYAPLFCFYGSPRPNPTGSMPDIGACENHLGSPNTGIEQELTLPMEFVLLQNYPNPFNPSSTISWQLPEESNVTIKVFNLVGEEVATLLNNEYQNADEHSTLFIVNSTLPSGVYFYQLRAGSFVQTKKMLLLK